MSHNSRALRALLACLATDECAPRQADVVILASRHFLGARRGEVGGEAIWYAMAALDELGYTTLFADNIQRAVTLHALFPSLVRAVVANEWDMQPCANDAAACVKSAQNPLGIPAWKLFSFSFFRGVDSSLPLGDRWVLAPEDYPGSKHVHIGYSIERTCEKRPPAVEREPIAYVLGKHKVYWQERFYIWEGVDWTGPPANLTEELGLTLPKNFKFVACVDDMYAEDPKQALPNGIENICGDEKRMLAQEQFVKKLAASRLLVGVGRPWVSPTPYDALCLGVPFLNPIHSWNKRDPDDREKWITQHDGLKFEERPLVYHVRKSPSAGQRNRDFWVSVLHAVNTPIQRCARHVPERMTMVAVRRRVDDWLQHDWRAEAQKSLEEQTGQRVSRRRD
ncbi:hypothetical protein AURDEDRAFT_57887 [Auricularia subglabra TFB-10046 SS5]|nr:hypothetical protein AURDEDRAFT_57887 [Auricularia subglabra TFB-10046 SS5]